MSKLGHASVAVGIVIIAAIITTAKTGGGVGLF
jgi:hypothetical protein